MEHETEKSPTTPPENSLWWRWNPETESWVCGDPCNGAGVFHESGENPECVEGFYFGVVVGGDIKNIASGPYTSPGEAMGAANERLAEFREGQTMNPPATIRPHFLVYHTVNSDTVWETISYPYPGPDGRERVKVRSPGDPTTLTSANIAELQFQPVICDRDQTLWYPRVHGEFKETRIECPTCGEVQHAVHDAQGVFQYFKARSSVDQATLELAIETANAIKAAGGCEEIECEP